MLMQPRVFPAQLAIILLLSVFSDTVLAHRFTVVLVAPFSGPETARGRQFLHGFLLATRERDRHAGEDSDGHLGGLDSYVVQVDVRQGPKLVAEQLRAVDTAQGPVFVTSLLSTGTGGGLWDGAFDIGFVVEPALSPISARASNYPERVRTMDDESFFDAFRAARDNVPGGDAMRGYIAARLIDATVRTLRGDLTRPDVVAATLMDATLREW